MLTVSIALLLSASEQGLASLNNAPPQNGCNPLNVRPRAEASKLHCIPLKVPLERAVDATICPAAFGRNPLRAAAAYAQSGVTRTACNEVSEAVELYL